MEVAMNKYEILKEEFLRSGLSLTKFCKEQSISRTHFTKYLKENNVEIINKQNIARMNENVFKVIDTEDKAYWLRFMYADGYVCEDNKIGIGLKEEDYEHLVRFKEFLEYDGELEYNSKTKSYRVSFRNKSMKEDLINLGCVPRKSKVLEFPTYDIVPKELMIHFIRGYIDGDGYVGNDGKYLRLSILGTESVLKGIINELNLREVKIRKANKDGAEEVKSVEWKGRYLEETFETLYKNSTIYLDRKYKKYKEVC